MAIFTGENLSFQHESWPHPDASSFYKHMHSEYEMLYFIKGAADYVIGGSLYHLRKNDLLLIKPAVYHYLKLLSASPYERFVIHFTEKAAADFAPCLQNYGEFFSIPPNGAIDRLFFDLKDAAEKFAEDDMLVLIKHSLNAILSHLKYIPPTSDEPPKVYNRTLEEILEFIDENPREPLNADILSKKFFVSPSWIVHTFNKHLGISLMQYINRKKILYAQQLIKSGKTPTRAAELCSFGNYSTFYRQYKRFLGVLPQSDKREE